MDGKGTKLVYETDDCKMSWESTYQDEAIENIVSGFYALCIGQTWSPITVLEAMKRFAEDRLTIETDEDELKEFSHIDVPILHP